MIVCTAEETRGVPSLLLQVVKFMYKKD